MSNQLAALVFKAKVDDEGEYVLGAEWHKRAAEALAAHEAAKPAEPVYYEFRPVSGADEWRRVKPRDRVYGVGEALADIRAYRYEGKPCYEIRALYAAPVAVASPLTDEQLDRIEDGCWDGPGLGARFDKRKFARAIEATTASRSNNMNEQQLPKKPLSIFDNCPRGFEDELVRLMDDYARAALAAHGIKEQQHAG